MGMHGPPGEPGRSGPGENLHQELRVSRPIVPTPNRVPVVLLGPTGIVGSRGVPGSKGDKGDPGQVYKDGPTPGEPGKPGQPGPKGLKGDPGIPGTRNIVTPQIKEKKMRNKNPVFLRLPELSSSGSYCLPGVPGDSGPPGVRGPPGSSGVPGAKGQSVIK